MSQNEGTIAWSLARSISMWNVGIRNLLYFITPLNSQLFLYFLGIYMCVYVCSHIYSNISTHPRFKSAQSFIVQSNLRL